jgi:hypothetical protein
MAKCILWVLAALLCGLSASAAVAQQPSAQAFLEAIYKPYLAKNYGGQNYREADRLFAPDLARAMNADNAAAAKRGEVPLLDGDPFVCAQEWEVSKLTVAASTAGTKTTGKVAFDMFGKPRQVTLDLVLTPAGWRIANIVCSSDPTSLRALYKLP